MLLHTAASRSSEAETDGYESTLESEVTQLVTDQAATPWNDGLNRGCFFRPYVFRLICQTTEDNGWNPHCFTSSITSTNLPDLYCVDDCCLTRADDCFQGRDVGMQSVWHADHLGMPAGCTTVMAVHSLTCELEGSKVEWYPDNETAYITRRWNKQI